jgi:hypothetical protein
MRSCNELIESLLISAVVRCWEVNLDLALSSGRSMSKEHKMVRQYDLSFNSGFHFLKTSFNISILKYLKTQKNINLKQIKKNKIF